MSEPPAPLPGLCLPAGEPFHVLYVCTGNVCRSVLAERLTRRAVAIRLGDAGGLAGRFHIGSAGTEAAPGRAMHPYVRDLLRARDADVGGFARRRLTAALVAESDLVLTATTVERDRAISLVPAALGRTFTVKEFARLAGGCDTCPEDVAQRARLVVAAAQHRRGQMPYVDPVDNDIADPPPTVAAFAQCAATIAAALETILDALCPRHVPADPGLLPA